MKKWIQNTIITLSAIGIIALCGATFYSCKTNMVYVPVETVRTEYNDKLLRDSIFMYDSIMVKMKGDTVWMEKYRYLYRDKLVRDSIFVSDSVQVPYPIIETKEVNRLTKWQTWLIALGGMSAGFIIFKLILLVKKII